MRIDSDTYKLVGLFIIQTFITTFKTNITRFIIRNYFSKGEIPITKWFTLSFILSLNVSKVLGLIIIASFTLITFPLGIWIASFSVGKSYPVLRFMGGIVNLISLPLNIYMMNKVLNELPINKITVTGFILHEVAFIILLISAYFMYKGGLT